MKSKKTKMNMAGGQTPMDAALHYLGYRARTVREMERYLDEKQFGEYEIMQTVDRLSELGLLDDGKFCKDFVDSRLRTKPISRRHLRQQLFSHEVSAEIIEYTLSSLTDEVELQNAICIAEKFHDQFSDLPQDECKKRLIQRLLGRGFDYSTVIRAYERVMEEEE